MVAPSPALFRLLGDDVRLRLLRMLAAERLNVSELTAILGLAQSGVSRHLGLLKEGGLVVERREGGFTYFSLAPAIADPGNGDGALAALLQVSFDDAARTAGGRADDVRLDEVRRQRRENFDRHAGPDSGERQLVPGRSWAAWARALGHLLPPMRVADIGCGDGYLTIEASRWASRVLAIDRSTEALARARALATRRHVRNVTWKRGEIEHLPLRDASVDLALLSQSLHHASDPQQAVAEAARVVVSGGRVLVLDLREHHEAWVRERFGDIWPGFTSARLAELLEGAGLEDVKVTVGSRRAGEGFTVLVASAVKPKHDPAVSNDPSRSIEVSRRRRGQTRAGVGPREP